MVRFVEAIGDGDPAELDRALAALASRPGSLDLDAELLCGETPLGVAARCGRTATARRLLDHGAHLDVLTAWDLGWKDVAADLLRQRPELANARRGETGATPLMVAIERGDEALARLVLSAGPDLHLTDLRWGADALGWAEHFGRQRLAAWIREAGRRGGACG
jgi:ankyrin repeat protein